MLTLVYMDLLDKIKNLSKKQKAYFGAFMAIVALLAWAFISAGVITHNFNRSQLQTDQDRQEASIDGITIYRVGGAEPLPYAPATDGAS